MKKRRITIIALLFVTLLLGIGAIVLGYILTQEEQAPQDISASDGQTCCDNQCSRSDICWCAHLVGVGANKCTPQINADEWICGSGAYDGQVCYTCPTNHPEVPDNLEGQVLCTTVAADTCSDGKAACGGVTPEPEPEPEPEPKACGETCQTDSDCIGTTSAGDPVTCYNGVCRNETCPTDNSQGTICLCTSSPACGQPCGYFSGGGLCDNTSDGIEDTCRYINGPQCTLGSTGNPTTYCVPDDNPAIETLNCTARDQGNSYVRRKSDGKTSWTAAEIAALCQWCGNGIVDAGEECDPPGSTVNGQTCSTDCQLPEAPTCGDGTVNQDSEECEVGVTCGGDQVCNELACVCEDKPLNCGDGVVNGSEACDYAATPNGCDTGEVCMLNCQCRGNECGGACETDSDCPTDHTCDETTETCVLTDCVGNPDCTNNGCTLPPEELPSTAIVDKDTDLVLLGTLSVLIGVLLLKFDVYGQTKNLAEKVINNMQSSSLAYILAPVDKGARKEVQKRQRDSFEDKLDK